MAYKDKEKEREYHRQYYWNKTKLARKTNPVKVKSNYQKVSPELAAQHRREGAKRRVERMKAEMGEEGYREYMSNLSKKGVKALRDSGKPIGFQANAKEAAKKSWENRRK